MPLGVRAAVQQPRRGGSPPWSQDADGWRLHRRPNEGQVQEVEGGGEEGPPAGPSRPRRGGGGGKEPAQLEGKFGSCSKPLLFLRDGLLQDFGAPRYFVRLLTGNTRRDLQEELHLAVHPPPPPMQIFVRLAKQSARTPEQTGKLQRKKDGSQVDLFKECVVEAVRRFFVYAWPGRSRREVRRGQKLQADLLACARLTVSSRTHTFASTTRRRALALRREL